MDTATVTRQHNIVYLHGTFHQGDEIQFTEYSGGRQCVTNSAAAIAFSKICDLRQWRSEHLDQILKAGDILYQQIRPVDFFNHHPFDNGLLELNDLPSKCDIFSKQFEIHSNGSMYCDINITKICDCLRNVCQHPSNCDAIIVMGDQYGAYASSLIYCNQKIYIFDPHSLSHVTGMPCADGTSILLTFDSIFRCAEYLVFCANIRHAIQLSVWKLVITRIQQFQHDYKVLKFSTRTPETSSISCTTILQDRTHHSEITDDRILHSQMMKGPAKKLKDRMEKECKKSTHATQLKTKYLTAISEENIVTDQIKHTKYKISDRQCEILKLQKQIDAYEKQNGSQKKYGYLRMQVNSLQGQIVKLESLMQDLTDKKNQLHEQKESIRKNLQLCDNEISADENITLDTLPCTNSARHHQAEYQNHNKRPFPELIEETSKSSQSTDRFSAKRPRHSNCQSDEYRKFLKREYIRKKRLSTEYQQKENMKQRERDSQRRSSTEFRQKESLKQMERNAQKRSSTEFRQKENSKQMEHKKQKRSSTEFRQKESLKQMERNSQKHSSTEFRQKESLKQMERNAQKRSSTEFRQKESLKQMERNAQKRSSTEFRQKESLKQKERNSQKRSSTEFRQKESLKQMEHNAQKRSSTEFRQKESLKQMERNSQKRSSTEFRQKESLKQIERNAQKRSSTEFRDNEKERQKYCKAQKCTVEKYRDKENAHKQARTLVHTYGNSLSDSIKIFLDAVSQGPIYVCSSCLQTNFADSVVEVSTLNPGKYQPLLEECLTRYKSINEKEWLCLSCK